MFGLDPRLPKFRSAPSTTAPSTARRCYLCGKVGHVQSQCLRRAPDTSPAALSKLSGTPVVQPKVGSSQPQAQGRHLSFQERVNPGLLHVDRFLDVSCVTVSVTLPETVYPGLQQPWSFRCREKLLRDPRRRLLRVNPEVPLPPPAWVWSVGSIRETPV